jgi:arginyl-tRNA synthetase
MLDRMSDALSLLAAPLIDAAGRLGVPAVDAVLERPGDPEHGDYATTLALRLAKPLRRPPREIAEELAAAARESAWVESADVAGPGFVNVRVSTAWYAEAVRRAREPGFGGGTANPPQRVNVEYVSANPTGLLPVSAGRNAAYGDSLARLFSFAGHDVTREYYFNDSGAQIERFGLSLRARARGEEVPEDGYQSESLIDLAKATGLSPDSPPEEFGRAGVELMFAAIRATLERFRVHMDVYTNEVDLHLSGGVERAIARASAAGHLFEQDGATWLRASEFGDDKDRPVLKSDGSPTYLAGDLAYLVDKLERGFDLAIYVLGADHHGYVGRIKAAWQALGGDPDRFEIVIMQLVNLSEGGKRVQMSKRAGTLVLLDELLDDIGVDAARYFLLQRSHDTTIDLDLELARQNTQDNPVYYVQYAHARIASILRKAGDQRVAAALGADLAASGEQLHPSARSLIKRMLEFPAEVEEAAARRAPHRLTTYVHEVAQEFSAFYRDVRVVGAAEEGGDEDVRLAIAVMAKRVIASGLDLLGVSAPEEM